MDWTRPTPRIVMNLVQGAGGGKKRWKEKEVSEGRGASLALREVTGAVGSV